MAYQGAEWQVRVLLGLCLAAMAGCSTTQQSIADASNAPADRVPYVSPPNANASIKVVRDVGFLGAGCYYALYVEGELAARLAAGEMVQLSVRAGELRMSAARDPVGRALCNSQLDPSRTTRETTLKPGESKVFRLAITEAGTIDIMRAEP